MGLGHRTCHVVTDGCFRHCKLPFGFLMVYAHLTLVVLFDHFSFSFDDLWAPIFCLRAGPSQCVLILAPRRGARSQLISSLAIRRDADACGICHARSHSAAVRSLCSLLRTVGLGRMRLVCVVYIAVAGPTAIHRTYLVRYALYSVPGCARN